MRINLKKLIMEQKIKLCGIIVIINFMTGLHAQNVTANDGYFNYLDYEFFAQERLSIFGENDAKSRITILPDFNILPDQVKIYDKTGKRIISSNELKESDSENKYDFKVVLIIGSPIITHEDKSLLLGYILNKTEKVVSETYTIRELIGRSQKYIKILKIKHVLGWEPIYRYSTGIRTYVIDLQTQLENEILEYSFEQVSPGQLSGSISIAGTEKSIFQFANSSLGSTSSVELVGKDLTVSEAKLLLQGDFNITINMVLRLNKTQLATANFDLNNYVSLFSEEFYKSVTQQRRRKRGFLFFKSSRNSLNKFITQSSDSRISSNSRTNNSVFLKDVDNDMILRTIEGYIYTPFVESVQPDSQLMNEVISNHVKAADEARLRGDKNLERAHLSYIEYLKSIKANQENPSLENNALESLLTALNQKEGTEVAAAGTAAAQSNPYIAAAIFLSKGLVFENETNQGTFSYSSLRQHTFTQSENKRFNAQLSTQVDNIHTITKSYFPVLELYDQFLSLNEKSIENIKYDEASKKYKVEVGGKELINSFDEYLEIELAKILREF